MELLMVWRVVRRYWWLILIPVVITAALAAPALLGGPAASGGYSTLISYSAAQVLDAIPDRDGDYQDIWLASELTVNALTDWITSSSFRRAVAEEAAALGVEVNPDAIGIASDNERSVGTIALSYPDPAALEAIARAAITVLSRQSQNYFAQLGGQPAQVAILDEPRIAPAPPPLVDRFAPLLRVGLGLLAGLGLAFLAHYLDPTLRRREDVEALGLPVIAAIPRR